VEEVNSIILGLSHVGLTVKKLDESLKYYREYFGFAVLSDAERKGTWIEEITGIPGFHTRTVYLSVTPYNHLELFGFFHPETLPAEKETVPRVGISSCVFAREQLEGTSDLAEAGKVSRWSNQTGDIGEEPGRESRFVTLEDPNSLDLRILEFRRKNAGSQESIGNNAFYPVFVVEDMASSLRFYQNILGLQTDGQGESLPEIDSLPEDKVDELVRWVLLTSPTGACLKLTQPLNTKILSARPWRMERIGFTHVGFAVKNLERYYTELKGRGVNFKSSPQSVTVGPHKGGKVVYLSSPEGITLEFVDSPLTFEQAPGK